MSKNHILIIDDDNYTVDLYNMIIEWSDYKPYASTELSALKAMEKLTELDAENPEQFPDYILLDLRMPEMHGFDFIRKFEENFPQPKKNTEFIITTSSVIQKEKEKAFQFKRVTDFLIKPIPTDYLGKLLDC
ncbi:MAG TPA: response regulator [Tangfeifania sp.]|nr:response regulator [Tangfeifania sp.]